MVRNRFAAFLGLIAEKRLSCVDSHLSFALNFTVISRSIPPMPATTNSLSIGALWSHNSVSKQVLAAMIGAFVIAGAAQVSIGWPIPMTLQTLAILTIAGLGGLRVGAGAVALYLAMGAAGLPVFANASGGFMTFVAKPSGFFLFGFLAAAALIGWLFDRGAGRNWIAAALTLLLGSVVIYAFGISGMMRFIGFDFGGGKIPFASFADVLAIGVTPFIIGDLIKAAIALLVVMGVARGLRERLL
jgi:biotin transport system substrate-specific component